jgi:hypothetical protein
LLLTAQTSSFRQQYFPYYVWCSKYIIIIIIIIIAVIVIVPEDKSAVAWAWSLRSICCRG